MQATPLSSYKAAEYIKMLAMAYAKEGKSTFIAGQLLGVFPWQQYGGVIDKPSHLHFICIDQDALDGFPEFLSLLKAPEEALTMRTYKLRDELDQVYATDAPYNHSFFNALMALRDQLKQTVKAEPGVHVVVMSSFTTMGKVMERALFGKPTGQGTTGKGMGSIDLWGMFAGQMANIQNAFQCDQWHMIWEGHVERKPAEGGPTETLQLHGSASRSWPNNTSHNMRIRRETKTFEGSQIKQMYLEPQPSMGFLPSGGRKSQALNDREPDMTVMLKKLGYRVGRWNTKK